MEPKRIAMIYGQFSSSIHGPFDIPGLYKTSGLTGSESSFFNLARTLAERGHSVVVFCDCAEPVEHESGFMAMPLKMVEELGNLAVEVAIAWNEPDYLRHAPAGTLKICDQQLNDFGYCSPEWRERADAWISPSANHLEHLVATEGLPAARAGVIPNSVDLGLFYREDPSCVEERDPKRVIYCSSPDRGLHHLLNIWPLVRAKAPGATLRIFYRLQPWLERARENDDEVGRRARYIEEVLPRMASMGVSVHGSVSNVQMASELRAAAVLAYPCDPVRYTEGFGCSVLDAQAAGCLPVISDADALPSVHKDAAFVIKGKPVGVVRETWADTIASLLSLKEGAPPGDREKMAAQARKYSRESVTDMWEKTIEQLLSKGAASVAVPMNAPGALEVISVREKPVAGAGVIRFAEVRGTAADHASWWSFYDEQEVRDRHWHPQAGDVVLDVGAAFGSYALPALAMGARVYAFSPAEFDTKLLEKNLSLNPDLAPRCTVVREGLHIQDGYFDPDRSRFFPGPGPATEGLLHCRSLDSWAMEMDAKKEIDNIDWIKLDVEGAEFDVLRGGERAIRACLPKILVECHNFHDKDMERKVRDFLVGLGVGYVCDGPYPHGDVSHAFFEVRSTVDQRTK